MHGMRYYYGTCISIHSYTALARICTLLTVFRSLANYLYKLGYLIQVSVKVVDEQDMSKTFFTLIVTVVSWPVLVLMTMSFKC